MTSTLQGPEPFAWNAQIIDRYDLSGPRYTSYPTAPQFREEFPEAELLCAVARSNRSGRPLSLYFHIPFCQSLCYYCGCNKRVTNNRSLAEPYLEAMIQEMAWQSEVFDQSRPVRQLHWGGGTPTYISHGEMSQLMAATRRYFRLLNDDSGEYAVEIHPGQVAPDTIRHLRSLGFNRLSMGIQDFDPQVQRAVNRYNTSEQVRRLVSTARAEGYHSIGMDLIYGLPLQSAASLSHTLDEVIDLSPDRLSVFNYAHLPHLFKSQRLICEQDLPAAREKLDILQMIIERLQEAGYVYIGMDHFAKPTDTLVRAQREGWLQRNFQGYSTHGNCDLVSFGVSAISAFGDIYVQNVKELNRYQTLIAAGHRPVVKGCRLSGEDRLRQYIINQLICHFCLDFDDVEARFGVNFASRFEEELRQLQPMVADGLVSNDNRRILIHGSGRLLVRRVCMVFDEYLNRSRDAIYSKVI